MVWSTTFKTQHFRSGLCDSVGHHPMHQIPIRAHARVQVLSPVGRMQEATDASLSLPLPCSPSKKNYIYISWNKPAFSQVPPSKTVYFLVDMIWEILGEGSHFLKLYLVCDSMWHFSLYYFREEGWVKETSICCSTHLCIHRLILVCALTGDWTHNVGVLGWCSNQLSYPARAAFQSC